MERSAWNSFGTGDGWLNLIHIFGRAKLAQTYSAIFWLDRCFTEHPNLGCCLELGTLYGALSTFFGLSFPGRVITCDIKDRRAVHSKELHKRLGVHFQKFNVLSATAPKRLLALCRSHIGYGPKKNLFLFCDNGGKEREFLLFAPHLIPGDVIAVHDYRTEFNPDDLEISDMIAELGLRQWKEAELDHDSAFIGIWEVVKENAKKMKPTQRKPTKRAETHKRAVHDLEMSRGPLTRAEEPAAIKRPRYRFHIQGMPHTATGDPFYHHCAFTSNIKNFIKMMTRLGHEVIHYGGEGSKADCEHVQLVTKKERDEWFKSDWKKTQSDVIYEAGQPYWQEFNKRTIDAMSRRLKPRDFICLVGGANKPVMDAFPNHHTVEFGIGYAGTFAKYRCFPSYAWMHWVYGLRRQEDGSWLTDVVIPHYFDVEEFPFNAKARELARKDSNKTFLYLGRALIRKGSPIAADICRHAGSKLILAGQGFEQTDNYPNRRIVSNIPTEKNLIIEGHHVTVAGSANIQQRAKLLERSKALMCFTLYMAPFELVHAEAQMCGVPVICTDWGAFVEGVIQGVTGFRVRTLAEALYACKHVGDLDPKVIREHALARWSLEAVAPQYQRWFDRLYALWTPGPFGGFYAPAFED